METIETTCRYGICDGSGWTEEGAFDDIKPRKCLCQIEKEAEEEANN